MLGGFQEVEISNEHREILTANLNNICLRLNMDGTPEMKIIKVWEQLVSGKYIWFHLEKVNDGSPFSVCFFQPMTGKIENL